MKLGVKASAFTGAGRRRRAAGATMAALALTASGAARAQQSPVVSVGVSNRSGLGTLIVHEGRTRVLTALHLLDSSGQITVRFGSWRNAPRPEGVKARIARVFPAHDLAVLDLDANATIPSSAAPVTVGDQAFADGSGVEVAGSLFDGSEIASAAIQKVQLSDVPLPLLGRVDGSNAAVQIAPFRVMPPFDVAILSEAAEAGDSGGGVFSGGRLIGVVVLRSLEQGKFVGVAVPTRGVLVSGAEPSNPLQRPGFTNAVRDAHKVALSERTPWRSVEPVHACAHWKDLLKSLEQLDQASLPERLDASLGSPLGGIGSGPGAPIPAVEAAVKGFAVSAAADPGCGGHRATLNSLTAVFTRIKELERRIGTLQTLWRAARRALLTEVPASAAAPLPAPLNAVEKLVVDGLSSAGNPSSMTAGDVRDGAAAIHGVLQACAADCAGGLAADDQFSPDVVKKVEQAVEGIAPSTPLQSLVSNPALRTRFLQEVVSSGLIRSDRLLVYAGGIDPQVLNEKIALLPSAVPAANLAAALTPITQSVPWKGAKVHAALTAASAAEEAYMRLSDSLRSATTVDEVLQAFTEDPASLTSAFRSKGPTARDALLKQAADKLDDVEMALGAAIREYLEGPSQLSPAPPYP